MLKKYKSIKLILGDQLNELHPWFDKIDEDVLFVLMEVRSETDYVKHHIQKVVAIFDSMRKFSEVLVAKGHHVKYFKINDFDNQQSFTKNLEGLVNQFGAKEIHYQLPDEYRVDQELKSLSDTIGISVEAFDTYHFLTTRNELGLLFEGKKSYLMETFYRYMRLKHSILLDEFKKPIGGKWNYDQENRKKVPKNHQILTTPLLEKSCADLLAEIEEAGIQTLGEIDSSCFSWTTTRQEALSLLDDFVEMALPYFGTLQDAMTERHW